MSFGTIHLRAGQTRTIDGIVWADTTKTVRESLVGRTFTVLGNTLDVAPVVTVTDAAQGEFSLRLEGGSEQRTGVFDFVLRLDDGGENEIDFPRVTVQVVL